MTDLRVTAVVTSHDRREFLPAAVRSALDGGVDEVVVVRNFSGSIDGCEGRYRDILCTIPDTLEKESRGVEEARGEIIGFLDDDDIWSPEKPARLRTIFAQDSSRIYFCHAHQPIDAQGQPAAASHRELSERHPERFEEWDGADFEGLVRTIWPGNNSSTVVRRDWAMGWLPAAREAGWSADLFWLTAALLSERHVLVAPDKLTLLRLHDQNMSHARSSTPELFRERHRITCERFARSNGVLARLAGERSGVHSPISRYLSRSAEGYRFFAALEADARPRRAAGRALLRGAGRNDRGVRLSSLAALISPAAARRLLYRSSIRRWSLQ